MVKKIISKDGKVKTIEKLVSNKVNKVNRLKPLKKNLGNSIDKKSIKVNSNSAVKSKSVVNIEKSLRIKKSDLQNFPTLGLKTERDIAMDFAEKVYTKFDRIVKSVILFGSSIKGKSVAGSDIDIIIIVDDAIVNFDENLIKWYRDELGKIISANPYKQDLHVNTVKLTTWWDDLYRGDPVVINIIRYGESIIDFGGFFEPFKILLQKGKIRTTRESIYTTLNRVPEHIIRSEMAQVGAIDGCYWAMVESAQSLLMSINVLPPSPEHIAELLNKHFVRKKLMKPKHVSDLINLYNLHRRIVHGETRNLDGKVIDYYQEKANEFLKVVLKLIQEIIE